MLTLEMHYQNSQRRFLVDGIKNWFIIWNHCFLTMYISLQNPVLEKISEARVFPDWIRADHFCLDKWANV